MKLDLDFYTRKDVVKIARNLLGKSLFTRFEGKLTGGIITETEAYAVLPTVLHTHSEAEELHEQKSCTNLVELLMFICATVFTRFSMLLPILKVFRMRY